MTKTLVLDEVTLPQTGTVTLHLDYTFELKIAAAEARRKVHSWLVDQVSYMIRAGEPTLVLSTNDSGEQRAQWRVPAILTATHLGDVGVAGYVDVDVTTGDSDDLLAAKADILGRAQHLVATMAPYVPKKDFPAGYVAVDMQPTILHPIGSPTDLLFPKP